MGVIVPTHLRGTQPTTAAPSCGDQRTWHQFPNTARISTARPRSRIMPRRSASVLGPWRTQTLPIITPTTVSGVGVNVGDGVTVGRGVAVLVGVGVSVEVAVGDGVGVDVGNGVAVGGDVAVSVGEGVAVAVAVHVVVAVAVEDGSTATGRGVGVPNTLRWAHSPVRQLPTRHTTVKAATAARTRFWADLSWRGSAAVNSERSAPSTEASGAGSPP